jgi:hypothetical protein
MLVRDVFLEIKKTETKMAIINKLTNIFTPRPNISQMLTYVYFFSVTSIVRKTGKKKGMGLILEFSNIGISLDRNLLAQTTILRIATPIFKILAT